MSDTAPAPLAPAPAPLAPALIYVDSNFVPTMTPSDGSSTRPFVSLTQALSVAVNGDTILIASGTYTGNFDLSKSVTLKGPNSDKQGNSSDRVTEAVFSNTSTTISSNAVIDGLKFLHTLNISNALIIGSGATVKNCVFERLSDASGNLVRAISTSSSAENYNILNNYFTGDSSGGLFSGHKTWNSGLFLNNENGKAGNIENNTFNVCRTAINADDNNSLVTLKSNNFSNCGTYVSFGGKNPAITQPMIMQDNVFDMSSLGSALINNSNVQESFKLLLSNNKFKFSNVISNASDLTLEQKFLIENTLYHKDRSSRKGIVYIVENEQYVTSTTTIASALKYAPSSGDTIFLASGNYGTTSITTLSLNKSVKLCGSNKDISHDSTRVSETHLLNHKFDISANNVEINGIRVTGTNLAGQTIFEGNNKSFNNLVVKNTILEDINGMCLYYQGTGVRDGITFSNCKVSGVGDATGVSNNSAFNPWSCKNVTIDNCLIENVDYNGINLESVENAVITNNIIRNIGKSGIQLANSCKGTFVIKNNEFNQLNCRYYGWGKLNSKNNVTNPVAPRTVSGVSIPDWQYYYAGVKWFSSSNSNPLIHVGSYVIEDNNFNNCWCGYQFARELPSTGGPTISFKNNTFQNNTHGDVMIYRSNTTNSLYDLRDNGLNNASIKVFDWSKTVGNNVDNLEQWSSVLSRGSEHNIVLDKTSPSIVQVETGKLTALPNMLISNVLNKSVNGDTIQIASGTYTGNFDLLKSVTLKGPNSDKQGNSSDRVAEAVFSNTSTTISSNAIIDGLKFLHTLNITDALIIGSGATVKNCVFERLSDASGNLVRAISTSSSAENYNILNNYFTGDSSGGLFGSHKTWNSGLFLNNKNGKAGNIENNTFNVCRTAINADDNNSLVTLKSNNFSNCGTYVSFGGNKPEITQAMIMQDNVFDMSSLGSALINNSNVHESFKLVLSNNKFKFSNLISNASELTLEQKFSIENRLFHKDRSSRKGIVYIVENEQYVTSTTTIASALKYAPSSGDTIHIAVGTYTENITLNKSVNLEGSDKNTTIIQPSLTTTTATIQITDGSSGSSIKNLTVKGKYTTQTKTGNGNADNNNSAFLILNTNTTTNPQINNLLFDNLNIKQASNGIAFNNKHSNNISIKNCVIENNEGSGIRVASNTETMNGLLIDNCVIQNNNLNAITSNPTGFDRPNCTNFKITNCLIKKNNLLTKNNTHDVSLFGFNGNLEMSTVNIECNHAESKLVNGTALTERTSGGWGLIINGIGNGTTNPFKASGNIKLENIVMTGNVIKSCFGIDRYSELGTITINNVDILNCEANKANSDVPWLQVGIGHNDSNKMLNLGNTKLKTIYTTRNGGVDARNCDFHDFSSGVLFDKNIIGDLLKIEEQIYDKTDDQSIGEILFSDGNTFVRPTTDNAISNVLSSETVQSVVYLLPGVYNNFTDLLNNTNKPISLITTNSNVIIMNRVG